MTEYTPPLPRSYYGPLNAAAQNADEWRREIDALDAELLRLLNQRAAIACEIAMIKVAFGLPAYDGNRERQVLARVRKRTPARSTSKACMDIFCSIIHETRRLGTQRMEEDRDQPSFAEQFRTRTDSWSCRRSPRLQRKISISIEPNQRLNSCWHIEKASIWFWLFDS